MEQERYESNRSFINWYKFVCGVLGIYVHTLIRKIQVQGIELIPPGPKIIVANHANLTDAFVLPAIISEQLHFLVQGDIFDIPIIGKLLELTDQIPTRKGEGRKALKDARNWLERGNSVVIFPEGRMNNGGQLYRAGAGAAILAAQTNAPLVPMGFFVPEKFTRLIKSKYQNRPALGSFQLGGPCIIQVGKPWQVSSRGQIEENYHSLRETTEQIMGYIAELIDAARAYAGYPPMTQ